MTSMPVTAARDDLAEIVNRVAYGKERVCLTRHGKDVACLVSMEEAKLLALIEDRVDLSDAADALKEMGEHGVVYWDALKAELGL
jgi:prevent-host-death family protein